MGSQPRQGDEHLTYALLWNMAHTVRQIEPVSVTFDILYLQISTVQSVAAACLLQMLVLLDVNPEESMLDEGLAREVVNRIQKLRKKVN